MHRFIVLPMAGLLALAVAGPAAAAANTNNTSGGGQTIYGEFSDGDRFGGIFLADESGEPGWGEIYEESGTYVECDPAEGSAIGPKDTTPGEGTYGFVGTRSYGSAFDVSISFSRRLATGSASGQLDLHTETVDECTGALEGSNELVPFTVDLTGTGPLVSFRGHGSQQVPSEFNGHQNYRGTEREATGSLDLGSAGSRAVAFAVMSNYTWTEHTNN